MLQPRRAAHALLALFLATASAFAQDITASLAGTVLDPSGAVVANAKVTAYSADLKVDVRTVATDASGNFSLPGLNIGTYRLTVDAAGFKKAVRNGIVLNVNDKTSITFNLEVGNTSETVTVEASALGVQLASSEQSDTVNGTQIRELALITRNYEQLIGLLPGVNPSNTDQLYVGNSLPSGQANVIPFSINGTRNSASAFTVDGADNVDRGSNQTVLNTPSIDSIAEFKVSRSTYSAELGRAAGGQVSVITKSGTPDFHGNLYEFVRNDAFSANNFLNNATKLNLGPDGTATVPQLRYNDFGWTLGGPLYIPKVYNTKKNKTFFFFSEEFRRYITYASATGVVLPTDAEKQGIFPHQVCTSYSGFTTGTCNNFVSSIPASLIAPTSAAYLKDVFSKIATPQNGNSLSALFRNVYNFEQELYKVDHHFSDKLNVSARFLRDQIPTTEPQGLFTGVPVPGYAVTSTNSPGHNWTVRGTSTFSPTWLNEAGFAYSYGAILSDPTGFANSSISTDVKPKLPFPVTLSQIPGLAFNGGNSLASYGPYRDYNKNYNYYDNMTKIVNNHTIKFGVTINAYEKHENAASGNQGTFTFTGTAVTGGATAFEQSFANFLVGNVSTFSQSSLDVLADVKQKQWEGYVQDDWKIRKNLTLNLGVRYSKYFAVTDVNNQLTTFDPKLYDPSKVPTFTSGGLLTSNAQLYTNGISIAAQNSPYGNAIAGSGNKNFAPRVGFAYDPFGKGRTSVRGGFGIFYDSGLVGTYEQNEFANPPYVNAVSISNVSIDNPAAGTAAISTTPKALRGVDPGLKVPYTEQWNFGIQHQVTSKLMLDVSYNGTKGTHLLGIVDINMLPVGYAYTSGLLAPGTVLTSSTAETVLNIIRPYKGYNAINLIESRFNSTYNALQSRGTYKINGDSQVGFAYTWAKNLSDNGSDRSNAPQNTYDIPSEKGRAAYDRRQVFNLNSVYALPFFKKQNNLVGKVLGGWQTSVIFYAMTGLPLTATTSNLDPGALGLLGSSAAGGRPDMICNPNQGGAQTRFQWFNTACFAPVPAGQIRPGNEGRYVINGPGFTKFDLSLSKNVVVKERFRFQLRGEATNAFNHSNPNAVAVAQTTPSTFGTVTSYRDPRIIQIGAKFYY